MKRKISQDDELNLEEIIELPSKKKKKSGHVDMLKKKKARGIKQNTLDDTVSPHHTQLRVAFDTLTQLEDNGETPSKKKKKTKKVTTDEVSPKQTQSSVSLELKTSLNNNRETPSRKKKTKKVTTDEVSPQQTKPLLSPDTKMQLENSGENAFKRKKKTRRVTRETPDEVNPTPAQPQVSPETKTQLENNDETHKKKKTSKKKSKAVKGGVENLQKGAKKKKNPNETDGEAGQQSEAEDKGTKVVQYLRQWHSDRPSWKFSKLLQVRLFHQMYNTSVIPDEDFSSLLLYLEGLQGKGREKTKEDAKKILDEEEGKEAADPDRESRARQIYQLLD